MSKELSRLEEVELRDVWPNEAADFTPWLAEEKNLNLLAETLGLELELEEQEISVGDFQADILCKNEDDSWVVIENQLEETNHSHLGQILTYAAGLDAYTVIWIAKKFREEHRAALDHLNEITDERLKCFGVEVKVWQIGDSARAPQFEIVSSPNDWSREVDRGKRSAEDEVSSEIQERRKKFWKKLCDYAAQADTLVKFQKPGSAQYLNVSQTLIEYVGFNLQVWLGRQNREIAVRLYMSDQNFYMLEKQREEIDKEFGEPLEWEELQRESERSRVSLRKDITNPINEADWQNQHKWIVSKIEKFREKFNVVFSPRLQKLNAPNREPLEDEDDE